ncbi:AMP-binding protein [Tritonibacter mobilis]|nr:AMP-binding protein [Tritonibacter mobilis]
MNGTTDSLWTASEVDRVRHYSIGDSLRAAVDAHGPRSALIDSVSGQSWSFIELLDNAERTAHVLLGQFAPGDHVAIWAANCPEWVFVELGAALAGITLVTINPAYSPTEARYVIQQSQARGVLVQSTFRDRDLFSVARSFVHHVPELDTVISIGDLPGLLKRASPDAPLPRIAPETPAQIQYTSGTTGFPKGALLSHVGLSNVARLYAETIGAVPGDVWINPMPMFHTAGCGLVTLGALQTGGTHVLPNAFDAGDMLSLFEKYSGTIMLSVPTMLYRILDHPDAARYDLSSWRLATLGGAPVPPELIRRAERELGIRTSIGFGQTEASPYFTHTRPDDPHPAWFETIGQPLPGASVRIADPATGQTLPLGETGEICTRGVGVMLGYFHNPAATEQAIDADGWLHTGDLGSMDAQGYLRVEGRLKDMIIRGGENIYPREIEDLLFEHAAIAGVAVIGCPDPEWGESVAAFVQFKPGCDTDFDELEAFCRRTLAGYKVPRRWHVVDEFPQTASGKIQKFKLLELVAAP